MPPVSADDNSVRMIGLQGRLSFGDLLKNMFKINTDDFCKCSEALQSLFSSAVKHCRVCFQVQ